MLYCSAVLQADNHKAIMTGARRGLPRLGGIK